MAGKGDLQSYANPRGQTMTTLHSDLCPRCDLPFFTLHSPQNCIDALRARVAQLEAAEKQKKVADMQFVTDFLQTITPKEPTAADWKAAKRFALDTASTPPDVIESLEMAQKYGGFD